MVGGIVPVFRRHTAAAWAAVALTALLAAAPVPAAAAPVGAALGPGLADRMAAAPGRPVQVIVTLRAQADPRRYAGRPAALLRALRAVAARTQPAVLARTGSPARRLWITNAVAATVRPAVVRRLARMRQVARVDLDPEVRSAQAPGLSTPPGPAPAGGEPAVPAEVGTVQSITQLPLDAIGVRQVWSRYGLRGEGVLVGNIDTGVDAANPDLAGKIAAFRDFVNERAEPYDDNGHGTHAIGTMIGGDASGRPIGVAPGARVVVAKAMGAEGQGLGSQLLAAAEWMADPDGDPRTPDQPAVVNNSWTGGDANDPWFRRAVRVWQAVGIVPVFAAGNAGPAPRTIGSPASYPESIAVAAVDDAGVLADFSSRGPVVWEDPDGTGPAAGAVVQKADLAAPGVAIVSSLGAGYETFSGTSMASPHVAGVVALLRQAAPSLGAQQAADLLVETATDVGPPGFDPGYGAGAVNALAAVASLRGDAPAPLALASPAPAIPAEPGAASGDGAERPDRAGETPAAVVSPLRVVRARDRSVRQGGRLLVSGLLTQPARLRAGLVRIGPAGRARAAGVRTAAMRPAGPFRLALRLGRARPGRYRLVVQAQTPEGAAIGRPVRLTIRIVRRPAPAGARVAQADAEPAPAAAAAPPDAPPPAPSAPGVGAAGPAAVPVTLRDLVDGRDIDLAPVLGEHQLPADLDLLDLDRLDDRTCRGVAVICLGADKPLLDEQLRELVNRNQLPLALRNLTSGDLAGILTQVGALLDQGDLTRLVSVQRVGDRVLRLAPTGPLDALSGLPDVPEVVVGRLQVVGVLRCPPAEVDGLPRVCVA